MRIVKQIILSFIFLNFVVAEAYAHESEIVHEEVPATVDPMVAIGVVVIVIIGGLILWKFVLHNSNKSTSSNQPKSQEQTVNTQTSSVPEAKKDVNNTPS